ncbi:2-oxo-4-hydroxy-4-carboxy-5-ureidoimidazoline decarboxylase [Microbacterium telephonicum]|uniref:2-oxo-4-hydroxy-4-carboxy-5-ureidoimidazoline decarboxylase n=1 Tax=Microbacterium telephonicum TaxID=1714841 RepID=A0A498C813_9MICO|nr:2-oxo-4-hydroxy-4-carboxy-5-ureidoimidazoline decarboxylase [Microbacterium telephonicum]RLK52284.1 2-oxo-4-hydroxy-4-carboxy-5-ureidoimidazoline decarboxylase [Microbacterium telephonicum]
MHLEQFNAAPESDARATATVWAAIPAWADAVATGRPYASVDEAVGVAGAAADGWTRLDLDTALAHHPRIGQKPLGDTAEAAASRREQASMTTASDDLTAAMAAANAAYEERFGRVFLIRAAGRTPDEMLAEARRRLGNDDDTEAAEALEQLRQIALLRLRTDLEGRR